MTTHHLFKDISGQRFGMLEALSPHSNARKKWEWFFVCDCGQFCIKVAQDVVKSVKRRRTPNCGCAVSKFISQKNTSHGMSHHPAYWVWRSMRDRCRLPTHQAWANYGARGIRVCDSWNSSFSAFWADMGESYAPGLEIDRIENNGDYAPGNCRWVPTLVNANNKRGNQTIETPDGPMTLSQASRRYGIGKTTLSYRIHHGWPQDRLFIGADFTNRESRSSQVIVKMSKREGKY